MVFSVAVKDKVYVSGRGTILIADWKYHVLKIGSVINVNLPNGVNQKYKLVGIERSSLVGSDVGLVVKPLEEEI